MTHSAENDALVQAYVMGWNNALYWVDYGRDPADMPPNPYVIPPEKTDGQPEPL